VSLVCDDNVTMSGVQIGGGPSRSSFAGAAGRACGVPELGPDR
jgi:hypothetical protein